MDLTHENGVQRRHTVSRWQGRWRDDGLVCKIIEIACREGLSAWPGDPPKLDYINLHLVHAKSRVAAQIHKHTGARDGCILVARTR